MKSSMGLSNWGLLLTLSILWGGSFFFVEVALTELSTLTLVFFRVAIAALVLWAVVFVFRIPKPDSLRVWMALLIMGVLNNVIPFSLIVWGQQYISSGLASILNATTPLFGVLIAGILLTDERFTTPKIIGVILGFVGTASMLGIGAISYGFAGVFGRRFKTMGVDPITTAAGQVSGSALLLLPIVLLIDQPFSQSFPSSSSRFFYSACLYLIFPDSFICRSS